jgi:DNA-binding SARP family transcriptional activator
MPDRSASHAVIDTARERSVSFAPPDHHRPTQTVTDRALIAVGPGRPVPVVPSGSGPLRDEVIGFPIQLAKVQRPALRDETLERPRLLDWLRAKVHGRVFLLLADAGYGKTTLLADFSRRTRLRTLWYRLDDDDRDWVSFLHHLVAAGREHDPTFAPVTSSLLNEIGVSGPNRERVLDAFIRELPTIVVGGAALIFDDFHLVDDAADVRHIVRELLARAPERLSIVFASRRNPSVPLARLRAVGEVAELDTDDLRFDASETTQLFTETYGRQLEPDVLADLTVRTEGWIASLQLVQAALRDRSASEIRRFVRSMTGADHDLYDYLAEEVVGDLPDELQRFLMDTSILQVVTPELAEVVSARRPDDVVRLTAAAERLTLLSRLSGGPRTHQRYHPLVREFLEARFRASDGAPAVEALHRRAAAAAAPSDWRLGAHHYREAGDLEAMLTVVGGAIPTIMGNGQYALAQGFMAPIPADQRPPGFDLILSRVDMQHGDFEAAITASQSVLDIPDLDPVQRDHALLNLLTLHLNNGDGERAVDYAERLLYVTADEHLREIAEASKEVVETSFDGDLALAGRRLRAMADRQRGVRRHHFAVTMFNVACCSGAQDRNQQALLEVDEAIEAFASSSGGLELAAAWGLKAAILMRLGGIDEAERIRDRILDPAGGFVQDEVFIDLAAANDSFSNGEQAQTLLNRIGDRPTLSLAEKRLVALTRARWFVRRRQFDAAKSSLKDFPLGLATNPGAESEFLATKAYVALASSDPDSLRLAQHAAAFANAQGAHSSRRLAECLVALQLGGDALDEAVEGTGNASPWHLTYLAELLVVRLEELSPAGSLAVKHAAELHPERWRRVLREQVEGHAGPSVVEAARLLEAVGDQSDIKRLRRFGRTLKRAEGSDVGRGLSRRLAHRIWIEDQGRTYLEIGPRHIPGSVMRRKVLALACFLISRHELSATRDHVLDALWPDLDPDLALNSLNQTLYFLRRVFEESYSDDLSPGYVRHDSELVWLDPQLVDSRSVRCRNLIRTLSSHPTPDEVERLVSLYRGRFALDFQYEEWASAYRDSLHAAYLEIVERSVHEDFATGHYDRGISIARRALEVDSDAEQIEVSLLRLYRVTGAHAAAAEQYAHYAAVMRNELGLEPPPLETF